MPPARPEMHRPRVCLTGDTLVHMTAVVTIRDLRNHGGEVLRRVERGERIVVTRDGAAVAELEPLPRPSVSPTELIAGAETRHAWTWISCVRTWTAWRIRHCEGIG